MSEKYEKEEHFAIISLLKLQNHPDLIINTLIHVAK